MSISPNVLDVTVNGVIVHAVRQVSKAGRVWFEAVLDGTLAEGVAKADALGRAVVVFDGEKVPAGEVHRSEPRVAKSGKLYGGGNLTVTHSRRIVVGEEDYTLLVTLTCPENKANAVVISVKALPTPAPRRVGTADGSVTFA